MTIYQEEMQRRADKRDCYCYPHEISGDLQICYKGRRIGEVSSEGNMRYPKPGDEATKALIDQLCEDAELVREYVGIYESAPPMICADVPKYRKFSEFNNIVFAGMYSRDHGFMFCTWSQGDNGRYLTHGHYTPDYESAKEDYATRANLISNDRLFNLEQSLDLYQCISYTRDYCDAVSYEKDRDLMVLQEKLIDTGLRSAFNAQEEQAWIDEITGQAADGFGEGLAQHEIKTADGGIYVSFWNSGDDYFMESEMDFRQRLSESQSLSSPQIGGM